VTELDAARIGVRYVAMETNCLVVLDDNNGFATHVASCAVGSLWRRMKQRVSYLR